MRRPAGSAAARPPWAVLAALLLATLGAGAPAAPEGTALVRGKVTREGAGVPGGQVRAYASFEDVLRHRPAALSAPSAADGGYRLELPPGTYHLLAGLAGEWTGGPPRPGDLLSYHGSNPFTVAAGSETEANFPLARLTLPVVRPGAEPGAGAIVGVATHEGKPLPGVQVRLYLDAAGDFRGTGFAAAPPTDERGAFAFEYLPESSYFVVARLRADGGAGPLAAGDRFAYYGANPVAVREGTVTGIELEMVSKAREAGNADARPRPSGTRISGRILDAAGSPVPGAYAFAYEERVMSHKKPAFISPAAGADGGYVLHLGAGGTYYVGARSAYGDSPQKGEWYGRYEGSADHSVPVGAGEHRAGVDIVVERILP